MNRPLLIKGVRKINEGKQFENDFVNSIDQSHVLVKRLNDNAVGWSGGNNTRFSSNNECDFILYDQDSHIFYGLELKSTKGSLTYWREDFEIKEKNQRFAIRKCQIQGLKKWMKYNGVFGIVINFRSHDNRTFFVKISNFLEYTSTLQKKSININDVLQMNPIEINSKIKKVHYKYDIDEFLNETRKLNED